MQTRIQGTTMPVLDVQLDPNESVFSESGELSWMTGSIQMTTHTQMGGGGGLFGVLKRVAGGGSLFMTEYRAVQYPGEVSFATKVPGHIVPVQLGQGQEYHGASARLSVCDTAGHHQRRASSSRWARASSAATAFCCSGSAATAPRGLSFQAN